jgi:hypothetical protein
MSLLNEENSVIEQEKSINYPIGSYLNELQRKNVLDFYLVEATKNKNFSKCSFNNNFSYESDEEKKKKEIDLLEADRILLKEIQQDYETYVSKKDFDREETLSRMVSITSITSINDDFQFKNNLESNIKNAEINGEVKVEDGFDKKKKNVFINSPFLQTHPFRNLVFSPYVSDTAFKKHLMLVYKGLVYSKKFLKVHISEYKREKSINLKASEGFLKISFKY